ncbi:T-cell activation Rho GTPase-activating protein-like [Sarcoramphus papa]
MSCSNLAICVGPNLLSAGNEDLLSLEAMLEVTEKVKALVQFLTENCCEIFGEETAGLSSPSAEESPAPMGRSTELPLEEERGPAGEADVEHQAKALLDAPPSPPVLQKAAGADTVLGWERAAVGQLHKHWDKVSRVGG